MSALNTWASIARDCVLAVLTSDDPGMNNPLDGFNYGKDTINQVPQFIWQALAQP